MTTEFGVGRRIVRTNHPAARGQLVVRGPVRRTRWPNRSSLVVASDLAAVTTPALTYALAGGGLLVCAFVAALTVLSIAAVRAWDVAGLGWAGELRRLVRGFVAAAAAVSVLSLALHTQAGRPWVFVVLPVAAVLAVAGRLGLRTVLRHHELPVTRVLAVGSHESVISLVRRTQRAREAGWMIVAACTPTGAGPRGSATLRGVPVIGDLDAVPALARSGRFDVVSVAQAPGWAPRRLHDLAWSLEGSRTELVVDPGLAESGGPRSHLAAVDRLHLVRLERPALAPAARRFKNAVDRTAAALLLGLTAPLLLAVVVALRRDGGPALVRHERLRAGGRTFRMLAFRCADADGAPTRIGSLLRRSRLDRLPQLVNVLAGDLAIVGPAATCPGIGRTPLVEPGLSGLWPVGPLAGTAPEQLERAYVENWTPALDAQQLAAAVRAGLGPTAQAVWRRVSR
jgi:lipopolysaccharide/colanic/teichoic acid biosynthesis glycosyltransferase